MSKVINIREATRHFSRILEQVAAGAEVVIARAGKPVARLVPIGVRPRPKRLLTADAVPGGYWGDRYGPVTQGAVACSYMTKIYKNA